MFDPSHLPSVLTDGSVVLLGVPILFVVFVLKGAFVGKLLPTSVFLPGYVVATGASYVQAAIITVAVTVGYMTGQYVIFIGSRQYGPLFVTRVPYTDIDPDSGEFERFDRWFTKYGGISIFVTNFVPWIRGLLTIPAGASSYPTGRYTLHMGTSTLLYHVLYVGLALAGLQLLA